MKALLRLALFGLFGVLLLFGGCACVSWFSVSTEESDEIKKLFAAELVSINSADRR